MSNNRDYMKLYMRKRYRERRQLALTLLGGKCKECGSKTRLEVDHIDHAKKTMRFERMAACGMVRFLMELKLCQLLCSKCHTKKTVEDDLGRELRKHGSVAMYRHGRCRCEPCRVAQSKYQAQWKATRASLV